MNPNLIKANLEQINSITLPTPAESVKEIRAEIGDLEISVITDKVVIQGVIHQQIFFVDLTGIVKHFSEDVRFSTFVDVAGALPEMNAQVDVVIEHIKSELSFSGLQLTQKIILLISAKVVDQVQFRINLNSLGPLANLEEVVGENIKQELVVSEINLPVPAIKIDDIVAEIQITDVEVITDKVIVQGIIHQQVFFIDGDNIGRHLAEDVSFSTFLDLPGAIPGDNVQVNSTIELNKRELNQIPGDLLLEETIIGIFVKVHRTVQLNIDIGAGPLIELPFIIGENVKQDLVVSNLCLKNPALKVKEIEISFRDLKSIVIPDKVIVQGIIHKQIFYVDQDNLERHQSEEVPFSNFLDVPGAVPSNDVDFLPVVLDIIFQLNRDNSLEQKVVLQYKVIVTESLETNLVPGSGPLIKVEEVIGENTKQILIERLLAVEPELPLTITGEVIQMTTESEKMSQKLFNHTSCLPVKALKVKSITPYLRDIEVNLLKAQVFISGKLAIQTIFIDLNDVVRNITELVPFEFLLELAGDRSLNDLEEEIDVEIENLSFTLLADQVTVEQIVVFKFTLDPVYIEQLQIITDVQGLERSPKYLQRKAEVVIVPKTPLGESPGVEKFGSQRIESTVDLDPPAWEISDIVASISAFSAEAENGGVRFTGMIDKEVSYLTETGQKRTITEEVPFNLFYENQTVKPDFSITNVQGQIIDIQPILNSTGTHLEQVILLTWEFNVTVEKIISIVTDLSDPRLGKVTKQIVDLALPGEQNPKPTEVVTAIENL